MSRKTKAKSKQIDRIGEARAQKTIANVREHYDRGRNANQDAVDFKPRDLAQRFRINSHTLRKERRFARLYTEQELEELLRLRKPNGMPLHWGHVINFITLDRKADRKRWQKKAATEGWSAPELRAAIRRETDGNLGHGGRPIKVPATTEGKLRLIIDETERWLRRYEAVCEKNDKHALDGSSGRTDKSHREIRQSLSDKLRSMSQLSDKLARQLSRNHS